MEHITIKIKGQVMAAYCMRQSLDINSTTFLFAGLKLQPQQTPEELHMWDGIVVDVEQRINVLFKGPLGMEDRDEIDVMLQQPSPLAGMQALRISSL